LGAMAGSLLAAFVLLPRFGLEGSFFVLALLYGVTVIVIPVPRGARRALPALAAGAVLALFPFGTMTHTHYRRVEAHFGERLVATREGIVETAFYLSHEFLGEPLYYRLATNSYSMSSTDIRAQRYMKLFAYLPAALHPRIERALVICFGVGSTASAVASLPDVRAIDVVDVSRDILEMSDIAYPDARHHPLRDRRVTTRVEDGRFFLQQTARRYDLITGEPPPPKIAGVVSLYTREYFRLLRDRLNPGGLATYWLPVKQLREPEALAIIRAFCDAFEDCSLWSGVGLDWMLMGSRGGIAPVSREHFSRLWTLPETRTELQRIAIDTPQHLVAQFMADAKVLQGLTGFVSPLADNFPRRLSSALPSGRAEPLYAQLVDPDLSRERLESSPWLSRILPRSLITQNADRFRQRDMLDASWYPELRRPGYSLWSNLAELIRRTDLVTWPSWLLDSEARMAEIARRRASSGLPAAPEAAEHLAIDALAHRRKPERQISEERFLALTPRGQVVTIFRHCLAGERARARSLTAWIPETSRSQEPYHSFFSWVATGCS
jgi:spermidine synthase